MMDPDLNDPVWREEREAQWKRLADYLSDEYSRKKLRQLRPMFFETEFDYGNEEKYGELKYQHLRALFHCPVQTPDRWRKYLLEDLPRWEGEDYNLSEYLESLADFNDSREHLGWDMETELEAIRYVCGDKYVDGDYVFEGRRVAYPLDANRLHATWIEKICVWLEGEGLPQPDVKWSHLIDYWVSVLPYLAPVFFQYRFSVCTSVEMAQHSLQSVMMLIQDYSLDKLVVEKKRDRKAIIANDTGRREAFSQELLSTLDRIELPPDMEALWTMTKQPGFKVNDWYEYLDPEEDNGNAIW